MFKTKLIETLLLVIIIICSKLWTNPLEINFINLLFIWFREYNTDSLSLVLITDADLEEEDELPISRETLSRAISNIHSKYVIFDILFTGYREDDVLRLDVLPEDSKTILSMVVTPDNYVLYPDNSIDYSSTGFSNISIQNPLYRRLFSSYSLGGSLTTLESIEGTSNYSNPFVSNQYKNLIVLWPEDPSNITTYNLQYLLSEGEIKHTNKSTSTTLIGYDATGLVSYINNPLVIDNDTYPPTVYHAIEILSRRNDFYLLEPSILDILLFSLIVGIVKLIFNNIIAVFVFSLSIIITASLYFNIWFPLWGILLFYIVKKTILMLLKYFKFKKLYLVDSLTGVLNRRGLELEIKRISYFTRDRIYYLMLDIDWFKDINDTYGHSKGDEVIKQVADTLKEVTKKRDIVSRFGGDEFCIVLVIDEKIEKDFDSNIINSVYQRMRDSILKKNIDHPTSVHNKKVTLSVGCGTTLDKADEALYESKRRGRNTFTLYK